MTARLPSQRATRSRVRWRSLSRSGWRPRSSTLTALELWRPLLNVCRNALARVIAHEQLLLQLTFERQPGLKSHFEPACDRALDRAHCLRRTTRRHELLGIGSHLRFEGRFIKYLVHQAEGVRLVDRNVFTK